MEADSSMALGDRAQTQTPWARPLHTGLDPRLPAPLHAAGEAAEWDSSCHLVP